MLHNIRVLTKGTSMEVNVSELGMVTAGAKLCLANMHKFQQQSRKTETMAA